MAHTWCRLSVLQPTSRMPTWCSPTIGEAGNLLHGIEECLRLSAGSLVRPTNVTKCAMPVLLPFVISPLGAPSQVSDQARMLTSLPFFQISYNGVHSAAKHILYIPWWSTKVGTSAFQMQTWYMLPNFLCQQAHPFCPELVWATEQQMDCIHSEED